MVIDDEFLYSVCDSKKVLTIWNRRLKVPIETIETSFEGNLTWVSLGPESEIITGASDGKIQIWQKQVS